MCQGHLDSKGYSPGKLLTAPLRHPCRNVCRFRPTRHRPYVAERYLFFWRRVHAVEGSANSRSLLISVLTEFAHNLLCLCTRYGLDWMVYIVAGSSNTIDSDNNPSPTA